MLHLVNMNGIELYQDIRISVPPLPPVPMTRIEKFRPPPPVVAVTCAYE